jgi:hypothetical protein
LLSVAIIGLAVGDGSAAVFAVLDGLAWIH